MNNEQTQISLQAAAMIRELRQIRYLLSEVNDNVKKSNLLLEHQNALPVKKSNQLREEMFPSEETNRSVTTYNLEPDELVVKKSNQLGYPQTGESRRT